MSKLAMVRDMARFFAARRRYFIVPLVLVLLAFAALLVLAEGSALAPIIYTLF